MASRPLNQDVKVGSVGDSNFLVKNNVDHSVDNSIGSSVNHSAVVGSLDQILIIAIREKRMFLVTSCMTLVLALLSSTEDMMSAFDVSAIPKR